MKHILITGASTGIGYAAARAFIKKGYNVFGSVRSAEDARRVQKELGEGFNPLLFDVTDHRAIWAAAQRLEEEIGGDGLAGLINNAGIATSGPLMLQPIEDLRLQFEVNVIGLFAVTQAFLPLLGAKANPGHAPGRILMISSVGGKIAAPFVGAYSGSKHALEGMSDSLRRELLLYGIDVVIIGPGTVKTPIWDKPSANEIGPYAGSDYEPALRRFQKYFVGKAKYGLEADWLGGKLVRILEKRKPRVRYSFTPNPYKDWVVPRLLPARVLDRIIGKNTGLLKR